MSAKTVCTMSLVFLLLGLLAPVGGAQDGEVYVVVTEEGGHSFFMVNLDDGTFTAQDSMGMGPGAGAPYGTAVGDFDNDGDLDFILARGNGPGSVYLFEKMGPGKNFAAPLVVASWTQVRAPGDIAVADFNGDGNLDFVVTHYLSTDSDLFLGDGTNGFIHVPLYATEPYYSIGADVADFNNDDRADFVVASYSGNQRLFRVNLGNEDGTFVTHDVPAHYPYWGVTAADFDGDGNADLIASRTGALDVYWGAGDGTFAFGGTTGLMGILGSDPPVDNFDFNGDGLQDVVVGKYSGYRNVGIGLGGFDDAGNWRLVFDSSVYAGSTGGQRVAIAAPSLIAAANIPPVALVEASPLEVAVGENVCFDGSGSFDDDGEVKDYRWDFGDGTDTTSGAVVSHRFGAAGTYTVTLTVVDDQGAEAAADVQITVVALPVAVVTPSSLELPAGATAIFDASESYDPDGIIVSYEWTFGDRISRTSESTVSGVTASHVYDEAGEYTVTLTITDDRGLQAVAHARVVVSALEATVRMTPRSLNLKGKGKWITATVQPPKGYSVLDIDMNSLGLQVGKSNTLVPALPPRGWMGRILAVLAKYTGRITVKFDRKVVAGAIGVDVQKVTLTIVGKVLRNGVYVDFEGSDTIRVINPTFPKMSKHKQ